MEGERSMNAISEMRLNIQLTGEIKIGLDKFNQLQNEWITRCFDEDSLAKIKADAIREMLTNMKDKHYDPAMLVIQDVIDYADKLGK